MGATVGRRRRFSLTRACGRIGKRRRTGRTGSTSPIPTYIRHTAPAPCITSTTEAGASSDPTGPMWPPPIGPEDMTLIHSATDMRSWVWISRSTVRSRDRVRGVPVAERPSLPVCPLDGNRLDDQRDRRVPEAGCRPPRFRRFRSRGVLLRRARTGPFRPGIAFCTVQTEPERWALLCCQTIDQGSSWRTSVIRKTGKNLRPVSVRGHQSDLHALFLAGTYESYARYSLGIWGIRQTAAGIVD